MSRRLKSDGITVAQARHAGATQLLVYCTNPAGCGHHGTIPLDGLPAALRIKSFEAKARCGRCGYLGGDVRPDYGHFTASVMKTRTNPA